MSLATIIRNMSASVDAHLKNQIVSSICLLAHWTDVTNKVSFVLRQMPPTTLTDLQKDSLAGLTEKDLQVKAFIDQVYVNEFVFLSVYVPRIIDVNTASLVTLGETAQDARFVRMNAQDRIIEKLVQLTYAGGLKNDTVNVYELQWEMQLRLRRLRVGLVKQTLLCELESTLDNIKKDLSIEIQGKMWTNTLFTNLIWKFNPAEHKRMFEGEFKLISHYGYLLPVHQEQPISPDVPICHELETSGRQWQVDDQALEDHRNEMTPGMSSLMQNIDTVVEFHVKKIHNEVSTLMIEWLII